MAKKRDVPSPPEAARKRSSKYFTESVDMRSNAEIRYRLQELTNLMTFKTDLKLLDQQTWSNQTVFNLAVVFFSQVAASAGPEKLEKMLRPAMDELAEIVAKDMAARDREVDPAYLPEGVSLEKPGRKRAQSKTAKKGNKSGE